jgi:hypothetical protein
MNRAIVFPDDGDLRFSCHHFLSNAAISATGSRMTPRRTVAGGCNRRHSVAGQSWEARAL